MNEPKNELLIWFNRVRKGPADFYDFLDVQRFEPDADLIKKHALSRMRFADTVVRQHKGDAYADKLIKSLKATAKKLLKPELRAAYDQRLRQKLSASQPPAVDPPNIVQTANENPPQVTPTKSVSSGKLPKGEGRSSRLSPLLIGSAICVLAAIIVAGWLLIFSAPSSGPSGPTETSRTLAAESSAPLPSFMDKFPTSNPSSSQTPTKDKAPKDFTGPYAKIDKSIYDEDFESAQQAITSALDEIPSDQRLLGWTRDFGTWANRVAVGKDHYFYLFFFSKLTDATASNRDFLEELKCQDKGHADNLLVCLNLKDGSFNWSRKVFGDAGLVVHPTNGNLYIYHDNLFVIDPTNGDIIAEHKNSRQSQGVMFEEGPVYQYVDDRISTSSSVTIFDDVTSQFRSTRSPEHGCWNQDNTLEMYGGSKWQCMKRDKENGSGKLWELGRKFSTRNTPIWIGDALIAISDVSSWNDKIVSFDGESGEKNWTYSLGSGIYRGKSLPNNAQQTKVSPMKMIEGQIEVLDGSGRIHSIDPDSGEGNVLYKLAPHYLSFPEKHGDRLIVSSLTDVECISQQAVLQKTEVEEVELLIRQAILMAAKGDQQQAIDQMYELQFAFPAYGPNISQGYARVLQLAGNSAASFMAFKHNMDSAGVPGVTLSNSPVSLRRMAKFPLAISSQLLLHNGDVYFGDNFGNVWKVNSKTYSTEKLGQCEKPIPYYVDRENFKEATGEDLELLRTTPYARLPADVPKEFNRSGGVDRTSSPYEYKGRYFRTMSLGRVLSMDSEMKVTKWPAKLDGVSKHETSLLISEFGPLSYENGIFNVDENMVPVSFLFGPKVAGSKKEMDVVCLARSKNTIGAAIYTSDLDTGEKQRTDLKVFDLQGNVLNELQVDSVSNRSLRSQNFIRLGEGYMLFDRKLSWIPDSPDKQAWVFGPEARETTVLPAHAWPDFKKYFGEPLVIGNELWVSTTEGHLLIFDISIICGG